jgi:hypothetical protein
MADQIRSSEYGDWLVGEISKTRRQLKSAHSDVADTAKLKLETLNVAKKVLLNFLTIQQTMFDAATASRRKKQDTAWSDAVTCKPGLKSRMGRYSDRADGLALVQMTDITYPSGLK